MQMKMGLSVLPFVILAAVVVAVGSTAASGGALYGLVMVHNGPQESALATLDPATATIRVLTDAPFKTLVGPGDLQVIDARRKVLYFVGEGPGRTTTLVGVHLADGSQACAGTAPLLQLGFVGFGISLDIDAQRDRLIVTGIANGTAGPEHHALSVPLAGIGCGPFTQLGRFGDADSAPGLHGSSLDVAGNRLFLVLMPSGGEVALVSVDLGSFEITKVVPDSGRGPDYLVGFSWDERNQSLVGLSQISGGSWC